MLNKIKNKLGQEEMIGFALIVIIIAVVLLIFISFSITDSDEDAVESYEVDSFIQAFLQYTTNCVEEYEPNYVSVQKLITNCERDEICLDRRNSCDVLSETLKEIVDESWNVKKGSDIIGYELKIVSENKELLLLKGGNETNSYRGSMQDFSKGSNLMEIFFTAYY
ncbi:MAG: hypothetical protein ABIA78_03780 [archaeon]